MKTSKQDIEQTILTFLDGTEYELITLDISADNEILMEVDSLKGADVDFCAELNRKLVALLDSKSEPDYALEVGSVSLVAPFKTKMQYEKNLGHDVEVMTKGEQNGEQGKKYRGQLVSVDEDNFSVDVEEKVAVEGKKRKQMQVITHTWRYDEVEYCKYDLKF